MFPVIFPVTREFQDAKDERVGKANTVCDEEDLIEKFSINRNFAKLDSGGVNSLGINRLSNYSTANNLLALTPKKLIGTVA